MSEMVERVAKAIVNSWSACGEDRKENLLTQARASIAAMREPTEAMKSVEGIHWEKYGCAMCGGLKEGWEAMIDEALR